MPSTEENSITHINIKCLKLLRVNLPNQIILKSQLTFKDNQWFRERHHHHLGSLLKEHSVILTTSFYGMN